MEMPEGWAKLANEFSPERLAFAMQLMKEMAEALHLIRTSADHGLTGLDGYKLCADKVLKKWREWK